MTLKDITTNKHFEYGAVLTAVIICIIFLAYCGASDRTATPKADQYGQEAANSELNAIKHEANANTAGAQADEIEKQRQELKAHQTHPTSDIYKQRKAEYDKVRKTPVSINNSNLDARERRALTELRNLYPSETPSTYQQSGITLFNGTSHR